MMIEMTNANFPVLLVNENTINHDFSCIVTEVYFIILHYIFIICNKI